MRVGLMTPGFNPHDAIGNDILGMCAALVARGDDVTLFTPSGEADFAGRVMHYADAEFMLDDAADVLIYHYCVYDPLAIKALGRLRCKVVIRYHNVTPADMMSVYSPEFGRSCRLGREMVTEFPDLNTIGFLSDSDYNARELLAVGVPDNLSRVLAPLHRCDDLIFLPDHGPTCHLLDRATYNILAVGRLMPNKGFDIMVETFGRFCRDKPLDVRLHHVGTHDARMQRFTDRVGQILDGYGVLHRFSFHGQASPSVLATLFRHCDLFWTMSLHEGFCVPAVEAMAFGLPILSSRSAALPETCGDVAVYADTPPEGVEKLETLLRDDPARVAAGRRSRARYQEHFRLRSLKAQFLLILDGMVAQADDVGPPVLLDRSGDWFGLPRVAEFLDVLLPLVPDMPRFGLMGRDRRSDLIDWGLRHGPALSPWLADYVASADLADYAAGIEMPSVAQHLSSDMRLCWKFHRPAFTRFDLRSAESVSEFWRWYKRQGH